ncbi:MAG TPA: outer membrane protein assembly factor BamD [candidate division Zixibacteria bacterium]|nr:outer membrane protein assembly factor BamD [candidate division Zixibacteria bacterium]MDD4918696.1 outer membrane protein assembly factor BamD [candidate division Zixibacteria bacterium]MDM7973959.1 outer membrane protein assembly factor BamD [candidate division Zixibacteria bacterium]HOD65800.1 outer membrane protein assembly factor BamD [candidate division Zixibacteria bacterium]HOZ06726.1 outer membrane protein assembly factor BamD [candidate division Zixibacteria bacterium]
MNRITAAGALAGLLLVAALLASCGAGSRSLSQLDARQLFDEGQRLYEDGKYRQAIEYFQTVVFNYPGHAVVDTAQYYLGLAYYGNEDFELAALEFDRLARNYPASAFFANAIFMRGVAYFDSTPKNPGLDQTELEKAIAVFEDFLIDFPESPLVPDVQKYLAAARTRFAKKYFNAGIVYERLGAFKAAKVYFQKVIDEYTDTDLAARAAFHRADMDLRLKDFAAARTGFESFLAAFPESDLAGKARKRAVESAYRQCRLSYDKGDTAEARQCLRQFRESYPANGYEDDVNEMLEALDKHPAGSDTTRHAES